MTVKGSAGHRQRQAEATKLEVARVARALFAEHGYVATTISAISAESDIPVQTIYSAFGSEGEDLANTSPSSGWTRRRRLPGPPPTSTSRIRLDSYGMLAELNRRQLEAGSDVVAIYREAAASDPQMAATLQQVLAAREREVRKRGSSSPRR